MADRPKQEELIRVLQKHNWNASAAGRELGIPDRTMRRYASDLRPGDGAGSDDKDKRKVVSQKAVNGELSTEALHKTPEQLMADYGLSDEEWVPAKLDVSERDAGTAASPKVNRSISLTVQPRPKLPTPAFDGRPLQIKAVKKKKRTQPKTKLVLIVSDYHAPFVDWELHQATLQMLAENQQVSQIIINGDLVDFPTVGRHRQTTHKAQASVSECIEAGGRVLADLRAAAPADCQIDFLVGNHDQWLSNHILAQASQIYDLTAVGENDPVWSFKKLFRLDELDINLIDEPHAYPHASIALTPHLIVHHGDVARKGSGASALSSMAGKDFAEIVGHIHRQSVVSSTLHLADGSKRIYQGAECGCMCLLSDDDQENPDGFPTYTRHPDWQQGWASVELPLGDDGEPTGHYSIDLGTWQDHRLIWRGQEYLA